jgi:hypothetical protein
VALQEYEISAQGDFVVGGRGLSSRGFARFGCCFGWGLLSHCNFLQELFSRSLMTVSTKPAIKFLDGFYRWFKAATACGSEEGRDPALTTWR